MTSAAREDYSRSVWRTCIVGATPVDRRNNWRFLVWALAWAVIFVGSGLAQRRLHFEGGIAWVVAVLPAVPAIGAFVAYLRLLREADEMVRAIQLQGLAYGFGAGVLVMIGVQFPAHPGAFALETDHVLLAMTGAWAVGQLVAARRYR
jgi:hypothetical protein